MAESFLSDNNFVPGDAISALMARRAVQSREASAEIDLLTGEASPSVLASSPVAESIQNYIVRFREVLRAQNVDPQVVKSAKLWLEFRLDRVSASTGFPDSSEVPVACKVDVVDDRGRSYSVEFRRWILFFNRAPDERPAHHQSYDHMR